MHYTVEPEIFARRKLHKFRHLVLLVNILSHDFLSCVNSYIEHMVIFTVLAKIYSIEYFCNTMVAGLGKFLSSENIQLYGNCTNYLPVFDFRYVLAT